MNFWRKFLTIAACMAMCLPLQVLESCCCAKAARISGTAADVCCAGACSAGANHAAWELPSEKSADRTAESTAVHATKAATVQCCSAASGCCGVKSASESADKENCEKLGENQFSEIRHDHCGLDCRCSCGSLSAPLSVATTVKAIDWSVDWSAVAASVGVLPRTADNSCVAKVDDRPPIAHNRRRSMLCVWQN